MQNTMQLAHQHIKDLQQQDSNDADVISGFYQKALSIVNAHLNEFFNQYATDEGLTLEQVSQSANNWDAIQFKQAVDEIMDYSNPSDDLLQRLSKAKVDAEHDKRGTMTAIVAAGIAIATDKACKYASKQFPQQYVDEYNYTNSDNYQGNIPSQVKKTNSEFEMRSWSYSDVANSRASELITKQCHKGMQLSDIKHLTQNVSVDGKQQGINNLSSVVNKKVNSIRISFKIGSIYNNNAGKQKALKDADFTKFISERDGRVCPTCQSYDGNIYPKGEAPVPQLDTHGGCRCDLVACDSEGNLKEVYPA